MKKNIFILVMASIIAFSYAKSWEKRSETRDVGYCPFTHVVVWNDSESGIVANNIRMKPISVIEFDSRVINLTGLKPYGLRIYYDTDFEEKKIVVHVAEDRGVEE